MVAQGLVSAKMSEDTGARHHYDKDCEEAANQQINIEMHASYCCNAMWSFFSRDSVALPGLVEWARQLSEYFTQRACRIMAYQILRGGTTSLRPIDKPEKQEWSSAIEVFQDSIALAKRINDSLLDFYKVANDKQDGHLRNFIESKLLDEHVAQLKCLGDSLTNLKLVGDGLGTWLFDRWLFKITHKKHLKEGHVTSTIHKHMPNPIYEP